MKLPLDGIRILDVGTLTPGKYCGQLLADSGAEVLRIERPGTLSSSISREDLHLNRGKRSITLNLREEAGQEVFARLARSADVLIESNRPGVAERIGIGYERVKLQNSQLVYCSLSGFGQEGPDRLRPAYDLTLMGMSGVLLALTGGGRAQVPPGTYLADAVSGLVAALAISLALLARQRDGTGGYLDLAMFDSLFSILSVSHGVKSAAGSPIVADAELLPSALYALYDTGDGRQITLAAIRPASCQALFAELGCAEMAEEVWQGEKGNAVAAEFLRASFLTASSAEWIVRLGRLDIEIGPVRSSAEAFEDAQLVFRRMVRGGHYPQAGDFEEIGSPLHSGPLRAASAYGADTDGVLAKLGYAQAEIARLHADGIV
jgi:crotonobetainyl-CoA:carnitine CoA-transferase CaiB-like acyl-CoA transferase